MYADEQGCKVSIGFLLPPVASLLILAIGVLIVWKRVISRRREQTAESSRPLPMGDMGNERKGEQEQYREVRVKEGFGVIMRDFVLYLTAVKDINKQREPDGGSIELKKGYKSSFILPPITQE